MRRLALPVAFLLLLAASAISTGAPRSVARGAHFEVICHFEDDAAARAALRAAEAVWPFAVEFYGAKKGRLAKPLEVHVYRNTAGYEEAEARLIGGDLKRNLAFAHYDTKSAHVALQPEISDATLKTLGLPAQTLHLVAHEASHAARFHAMPNFRQHPMWFVDGNAQWIGNRVREKLGLNPGLVADPWEGRGVLHVKAIRKRGDLVSIRDVLHDVDLGLEFYERYALRAVVFSYLQTKERRLLQELISVVRGTGGGSGYGARVSKRMDRVLTNEVLSRLDRGLRKRLDSLEPQWEEAFRHLSIVKSRWTQMAFPDTNAICWRTKPVGRRKYEISGRVTIHPGRNVQMNVLLGRSSESYVSVGLIARWGVTVRRCQARMNRWTRLASARIPALEIGHPIAFRIAADDGCLAVEVDGERVLETSVGDVRTQGAWGLSATAGSCGIWDRVRMR